MASTVKVKDIRRPLRVLIADDHEPVRKMVQSTLERHHFDVCAVVGDGAQAISEADKLRPDIIVLNISMPVMNGFEAAREIKAKRPDTLIVILSSHTDRSFVDEARRSGAQAYVVKTKAGEALVEAIESAIIGSDFVLVD
jgi:DNA-binding NarL/FixJ family response regulator